MNNMAGIFNVFKKQKNQSKEPLQQNNSVVINAQPTQTQTPAQPVNTQQQKLVSQSVPVNQPQSYNSYNGIGNPPSSVSYNGIGTPPRPQAPVHPSGAKATPPQPTQDKKITPENKKTAPDDNKKFVQTNQKNLPNKQEELDIITHLTQRSNRVFVSALQKAKELQNQFIDSEHVLFGLLSDTQIYTLLSELKVYPQVVQQELEKTFQKGTTRIQPQPSPRIKLILQSSLTNARKLGFDFISPEHMLIALYEEGEGVGARILVKLGLKKEDLNKKIIGKKEGLEEKNAKNSQSQNILEQFTKDLTAKALAGQLDPVVERSEVIERVIHILSRRTKNNPALVGEAGVGKTAIVEGLAQKIVKKEVPETLFNKRVLELDLMSIIAGASHRGEFEERMKKLIEEITASNKNIILFIDEIHNLVGAGGGSEGSLDASNFLKPSLARGDIQIIGATTLTEYRKYIEKDPALERRFQTVLVPEPTEEQAIKMLKALRDKYEAFHKVRIPDTAIESAVKLSKRYIGDRFLPDKGIDLIDEAASAVRLPLISLPEEIRSLDDRIKQLKQEKIESEKIGERVKANIINSKLSDLEAELKNKKDLYMTKKSQTTTEISPEIIKDIVSRWTGIPISKIAESETEKLKNLEGIMHKRLINQEVAVSAVAQAVRRGRAGLKSTQKPIGSFVFLGPTGVGKTELAKTLAEILFGLEEAIVRLDMTEFMEKHEVAKLLGAPPGYVGYEEGGKLTEAVRRKPYSVVLFDEIEKAHPDIFNILLQILDDGRLTDNKGHVISFKNTVVICTSNIGSLLIQDEIIKAGNLDIQEPPILTTYTQAPDGRVIATMLNKIFIKSVDGSWKSLFINDYFSNQTIQTVQTENEKNTPNEFVDFPSTQFDTHAFSTKNIEYITFKDKMYIKESPQNNIWKTISLTDYFKNQTIKKSVSVTQKPTFPNKRIKTHSFSPDGTETITYDGMYIQRKEGSNEWISEELKNYFKTPNKDIISTDQKKSEPLPQQYWDSHTFGPDGTEYIIVGKYVWSKKTTDPTWTKMKINELLGKEFLLDQELNEKHKVQEEVNQEQYRLMKSKVMNELRKFFRPELINRFDEVIIFEPLKFHHMTQIVSLQMQSLKKLLEEQNMGFSCSENASKEIARLGFDPIFGARPLKRTIQKYIENPISSLIIENKVKENDTIVVDYDGENFVFNIEKVVLTQNKTGKQKLGAFFCLKCGKNFQTLVLPHATTICPFCATKDIHEDTKIQEEEKKEEEEPSKKDEDTSIFHQPEQNDQHQSTAQSVMNVASA